MPRHTYTVTDGPKMLRETLCVAQARVYAVDDGRNREHVERLQRLVDECDRMRPLGVQGKHGDRHTPECGCDLPRGQRWRMAVVWWLGLERYR